VEGAIELSAADFEDGVLKADRFAENPPTVFYINARLLRSIYELSGRALDLSGRKMIFDEFDKAEVYGDLNDAVEGISAEDRRIKCDCVLKMSATSELSTLIL